MLLRCFQLLSQQGFLFSFRAGRFRAGGAIVIDRLGWVAAVSAGWLAKDFRAGHGLGVKIELGAGCRGGGVTVLPLLLAATARCSCSCRCWIVLNAWAMTCKSSSTFSGSLSLIQY